MTDDTMDRFEDLKENILKDYPRLTIDDTFKFCCHQKLDCFTHCCADVNIFLTPYDVMRMKNRLGMTSEEFLKKHTISPFTKKQKLPAVVLKMEGEEKRCPFVKDEGCSIYEDRPWSCRMYPVGLASAKKDEEHQGPEFYFLLKESPCLGFEEEKEWTIREWLEDQQIVIYNEMGELLKEISLHDYLRVRDLSPEKMEMFHTATYNLDKFKKFVNESNFLKYFDVDNETVEKINSDDVELMKFGHKWLLFSLFGVKTMTIKPEVLAAKKGKIKAKQK